MHGPVAGHYRNESQYLVISEDRIVFNHISPPHFQVQASFDAIGPEQTLVTFRQVFPDPALCAQLKPIIADKNLENLDRLEAELNLMKGLTPPMFPSEPAL